jgi:hypothetical protein
LSYTATTTDKSLTITRNFTGTIDSKGNFTGTTPELDAYGGQIGTYTATGTVTEVDSSDITVQIVWKVPYNNGGTFQTSTENWTLKKS